MSTGKARNFENLGCVYMRNFNPGRVQPGLKVCTIDKRGERLHGLHEDMSTVDPGQILICRQKSTSTVLYGHVNPFARNVHLHSAVPFKPGPASDRSHLGSQHVLAATFPSNDNEISPTHCSAVPHHMASRLPPAAILAL